MQLFPLLKRASRYALPLVAGALLGGAAVAKDITIAHVYSKTGALQAYGAQTQTGLMLGLDYATGGTLTVNGRKIVVIEKDDQGLSLIHISEPTRPY